MRRYPVFMAAAVVLAASLGATPAAAQESDDAAAVEAPESGPDVSRIVIRRPSGPVVDPGVYRDHLSYERRSGQHFVLEGSVNGHPLTFMLDTGASAVALRYEDARAAGIPVDRLRFAYPVQTANGIAKVAPVMLREVAVDSIRLERIQAFVAPQGALGANLLGNTFLDRIGSYSIEGDRLILRP